MGRVDPIHDTPPADERDMTRTGVVDMALGRPSASVVIPTYNYGRFLTECVESVRHQSGVDLDIVVVDDWSSTTPAMSVPGSLSAIPGSASCDTA